jgi:hypothetical protein
MKALKGLVIALQPISKGKIYYHYLQLYPSKYFSSLLSGQPRKGNY